MSEASVGLFNRAKAVTPGGVHNNSRYRDPHPFYLVRAEGPYVWDADGCRYLDCLLGNGSVILGHRDPDVVAEVERTLARGLGTGQETDIAVEAAERFVAMFPTPVRVRFASTGTEAALHVLRLARVLTGRPRFAKAEGSYNGWADSVNISTFPDPAVAGPRARPIPVPGAPGIAPEVIAGVVVLPFNDIDASVAIIKEHRDELAAVFLEPVLIDVGYIPPVPGYLEALREVTAQYGILLIFDEVLTGFRLARGGAQERFGVIPDLAITGKALSNGFPISAVYGHPEVMDAIAPGRIPYHGTFNGHAIPLSAAVATLRRLADGTIIEQLNRNTEYLAAQFQRLAEEVGVPARLQGGGGHFHVYFTDVPVMDYRTAASSNATQYRSFAQALLGQNVLVATTPIQHHAVSFAHGETEIQMLLSAFRAALRAASATPPSS